jgi:hypothetical protein
MYNYFGVTDFLWMKYINYVMIRTKTILRITYANMRTLMWKED